MKPDVRYLLVDVEPGGVLLDRESGAFQELNESAALIWRLRLRDQSVPSIERALVSTYGITQDQAQRDVAAALTADVTRATMPEPPSGFAYHPSATGFIQTFHGTPLLEVDRDGTLLRTIAPLAELRRPGLRNLVRAITPKILSLRGHVVLHASCVAVKDRLMAFLGASGAGKTTTARSLAAAGARLLGEDKVLVSLDGRVTSISIDAEQRVDGWVRSAIVALLGDGVVSCAPLDEAVRGDLLPLAEIGFLDCQRREGEEMAARHLMSLDTAGRLIGSIFLGSDAPADWARQVERAAAIASTTPAFELTMPGTLPALATAATDLVARGTIRLQAA
jgi:hypothetical protein